MAILAAQNMRISLLCDQHHHITITILCLADDVKVVMMDMKLMKMMNMVEERIGE